MRTIDERIRIFERYFEDLQNTTSRITKQQIVADLERTYPELKEDWIAILETLDGKYPIGWTFQPAVWGINTRFVDIASIIRYLFSYKDYNDLTLSARYLAEQEVGEAGEFIAPIVNRTLRLGIGKSLLDKSELTPMLAKKYEGNMLYEDVFVTEKLDGNRCIASYDGRDWNFTSRNGKKMKVNFDMTGLPTDFIYDGEVMSTAQTYHSLELNNNIIFGMPILSKSTKDAQLLFNETSGLINRYGNKTGTLIYTIFDVIGNSLYRDRRDFLNSCRPKSNDVRILPTLYQGTEVTQINAILDIVTESGGEGIMLNANNRLYDHKRSDALLKYKKTQFIDMLVIDIYEGKGKYEGMCGGLICYLITDDGKEIRCEVGTGLSDRQRWDWGEDKSLIVGKIIEVGYHEMTQDRFSVGTNLYSLRFPRLKRIRTDKNDTSEY